MKRLLLLGCGDIPQRLLRRLDLDQWQVTAMRRQSMELPAVTCLRGDATRPEDLRNALTCEPQFILVTLTPDARDEQAYRQSYLLAVTTALQQLQLSGQSPHIIFVSSTSVYAQEQAQWVDESSPALGGSNTARILCQTEQALLESGFPASVVRFSGIYGPGRNRMIERVRSGHFASVNRWTNRIHADDCAGILHFLLHNQAILARHPILLASDRCPVSSLEVEQWLASQMGAHPPPPQPEPTTGKRCCSDRLESLGYRFAYPDFRAGYSQMLADQAGL